MEATWPSEGPSPARRNRRWNMRRRRRGLHRVHQHHTSSGQNLIPIVAPLMYVMKYMVPLVLVFVTTLSYGGKPQRQLLESPAWMWCFFAATCAYWLIVGEIKQMATTTRGIGLRFRIYRGVALVSGILSVGLIVSMLILRPVSIFIPLAVIIILILFAGIKWARGLSSTKESSALPL